MKNNILADHLDRYGISYEGSRLEQLERFYEMLIEENKIMNLTAITEYDEVMTKHFLDSLMILKYHSFSDVDRILDLGTGGGFPGIPLKIFLPETSFLLMDSVNKKLDFVFSVIEELGLKNIDVCHGRAEDLARDKKYREKFDVVLSRAVANLSTLSELSLGFVKVGGCFISYKGSSGRKELGDASKAIGLMGAAPEKEYEYDLPGGDKRSLFLIGKNTSTPGTYPRKAGVPSKKPL